MRLRQSAALTAAAATTVFGFPGAATAAPAGTTLYVNNASAACSDNGSGSQAQPYCTVSAAAAVVQPGQTVQVAASETYYRESVRIVRSGTAEQPITFLGLSTPRADSVVAPEPTGDSAFVLAGVHDVVVRGFTAGRIDEAGTVPLVSVTDSSRVVLDRNWYARGGVPAVRIAGPGDHVTVSRSVFTLNSGGVGVTGGARSTLITGNDFGGARSASIAVADAPDTGVTHNTISNSCAESVRIDGVSPGAVIENNVVTAKTRDAVLAGCATAATGRGETEISVSAGSVDRTKVDYNTVHPWADAAAYTWAGTPYRTAAEFNAATGQAGHDADLDVLSDPSAQMTTYQKLTEADVPAIDSADPTAPGVDTDLFGTGPVDDPGVANTGPGGSVRDRGAYELTGQSTPLLTLEGVRVSQGPAPFEVRATATGVNRWGVAQAEYLFDFGDGTEPVRSTSPTVTHVYQQASTYSATVVATDTQGAKAAGTSQIVYVKPPGDLVMSFATQTDSDLITRVQVYDSSPYRITGTEIDFGDGSARTSESRHHYAAPGRYTVTVTVTDEGGRTARSSQAVEVRWLDPLTELQPGERVQLLAGSGSWLKSAGANFTNRYWSPAGGPPANSRYTAPNDRVTAVAVTVGSDRVERAFTLVNGRIYCIDRNVGADNGLPLGAWSDWAEVTGASRAGVLSGVTKIAAASIGGRTHIVALAGGRVYEASGTSGSGGWSKWGDITAAVGFPAGVTSIAAGSTGNSLHVAMLGADGHVRVADGNYDRGTWSGGDVTAAYGGPRAVSRLAAATTPGSRFHVVAISGDRIYETTGDYAAGYWTGWADVSAATGRADFVEVSAAATGNTLRLFAISRDGRVQNANGDYTAGRWSGFGTVNVNGNTGVPGPVTADVLGAAGF
ncbi:PKD domain-containing protein [Kitasatospora sp. NPDC048365]|uniref:PKD domain-containing protein n=1 Tax=Kitasatospora sp. NPDC048365 TaxID=3364050 RepID=UPI003720402C